MAKNTIFYLFIFIIMIMFLFISCPAPVQESNSGNKDEDPKDPPNPPPGPLEDYYCYWSTDGDVHAMQIVDNILYLGGNFSSLYPNTGCGVIMDKDTGSIPGGNKVLYINNHVFSIIPDGQGGFYIGGWFTEIGNTGRNRLARINADGSLHAWNPDANDNVNCLAVSGNIVFAGGEFSEINGESITNLAAIDALSGNLIASWNPPGIDGEVKSLAVSGDIIYVSGYFDNIGDKPRSGIAALEISTGNLTDWDPGANSVIFSMAVAENIIYVGGSFSTIGGEQRERIAALYTDVTSDYVTPWKPVVADGSVWKLVIEGETIYIGGLFGTVDGEARNNLAALDTDADATGDYVTDWNPVPEGFIRSLAIDNGIIYLGGNFTTIGGLIRNHIAAVDASGDVLEWDPDSSNIGGSVYALATAGNNVFAGGGLLYPICAQPRNNLAAIDIETGHLTEWDPDVDFAIKALLVNDNTLYAGGNFTEIGGTTRNRIAAFDIATGSLTDWNSNSPNNVDEYINTIAIYGDYIYAGGNFTAIGGQDRNGIAALNKETGEIIDGWDPVFTVDMMMGVSIESIVTDGNYVYVGGRFDYVDGQAREALAALDAVSGELITNWNPVITNMGIDAGVDDLKIYNNTIYLCGFFNTVDEHTRNYLAALNTDADATGDYVTDWNPAPDDQVLTIMLYNNQVYAGGFFNTIGGAARENIAALNIIDGTATDWKPVVNDDINVFAAAGNTIFAGGDFSQVAKQYKSHIAAFDINTGLPSE